MRRIPTKPLILICFLGIYTLNVFADSFRCGRKLVRTGDSAGDLLRLCGQPRYKDRGNAAISVDGVSRKVNVERWYYKKSQRSLEHIILLHKGRVTEVEIGSR